MSQGLSSLVFIGLMMLIFYFMLIRPQKRRTEAHRRLVDSIGVGDEVVTIGGMYGTVSWLDDDTVELDVGSGTRIKMVRSAIARRVTAEPDSIGDVGGSEP